MHLNGKTDLIIVGAGFAGLACAHSATLRGVNTIVIERKPRIGDRIHTTGILVKEAADRLDVPREFTRKIPGVRLYGPSLRFVDLISPGYYFLATDTAAVLRWQAGVAESAGAEIRCGVPFVGGRVEGGLVHLDEIGLRSRFLIGADGPKSRVAASFGLSVNREFLVGVESEWDGVRGVDPGLLHVFLDSELAPGYIAWAVPGINGVTQIGLAAHERLSPKLEPFLHKLQRIFDFSEAREVGKRGGLIPCGGTLDRIAGPCTLLIGDAAGTVSPLTAGGIHPAIEIGRLAGIALADHLMDGGAEPLSAIKAALPSFAVKRLLRTMFSRMQPPNWLYDQAVESEWFGRVARTIFFHHRGLLTAAAWTDLWGSLNPEKHPARHLI